MIYKNLLVEKKSSALTVTLNRPEIRNAFNDELISELTHAFLEGDKDSSLRLVVLEGAGEAFCAGGDLNWMKKCAQYSSAQNQDDARKLGVMLQTINEFPRPVVAKVHGAVFGGGLGLISVCDYVIASAETMFSFSEVKLGLIPAVIGPFVINKIGESATRALFLTGERFVAARAFGLGLVHQVVENKAKGDEAAAKIGAEILQGSPQAQGVAKKFIREIREIPFSQKLDKAAQTLADLRATPEGQEGLTAFLEKRKPNWIK